MSLITAIKSYFTPVKYYENNKYFIMKKLNPNGSTSILSYDKKCNSLYKCIIKEPINTFVHNQNGKNTLTVDHRTRVKNYIEGTKTTINKIRKTNECPIHNTLNTDGELVYSIYGLNFFHRATKNADGKLINTFNMQEKNNTKVCLKLSYNNNTPTKVKRYIVDVK